DAKEDDDDDDRPAAALELQELVEDLQPFLAGHGPDVGHHREGSGAGVASLATSSRKTSSNEARSRRTSSIPTPCPTSQATSAPTSARGASETRISSFARCTPATPGVRASPCSTSSVSPCPAMRTISAPRAVRSAAGVP